MIKKEKIIIIGGGPSGIMAAIFAKRKNINNEITIIERNEKIGKKILISGNGRCNLLNKNLSFDRYYSSSKDNDILLKNVFKDFDNKKILNYFENLGLLFKEEKDGKMFPITDSATSVVDNLMWELDNLNIKISLDTVVKSIKKEGAGFKIITDKKDFIADKVVVSAGSCAYSQVGTIGDGYNFAKNFKHKITNIFPSIVPLILDCSYLKKVSGIRFDGIVKIKLNNKILKENRGDILFTDYGVSGLSVISISRFATENLHKKEKDLILSIDFTPDFSEEKLKEYFLKIKKIEDDKKIKNLLIGLINPKLIDYIFKDKINLNKKILELNNKDINILINVLKNTEYKIIGDKGFNFAQVVAGGIDLNDINLNTLESKIVKNLYFTGEVIDIDGDCGGFNLMWAIASGHFVGENI